jgi:uncharacterized protein
MSLFELAPKDSASTLFGRDSEIQRLSGFIRSHRWVVVLGPRMVGKTSLVKAVRSRLRLPGAYVNLWGVHSVKGLVDGLISEFNSSSSLRARLARSIRGIDSLTLGPGGVGISKSREPLKSAWDLLNLLGSERGDCLVILDELQELSSNSGRLLELLGRIFNTRPNVTFVFTGSLVGLSRSLLEPSSGSPLYGRAPIPMTLEPFDRETSKAFIERGCKEAGISLSPAEISSVTEGPIDGIPGWLTLLGNSIAVRGMNSARALSTTIREGKKVAESELAHFLTNRDASLYWPALKGMALGSSWSALRGTIEQSIQRPVNDATVRRIVQALEACFLCRHVENRYELIDPMIRRYVLEAASVPRSSA